MIALLKTKGTTSPGVDARFLTHFTIKQRASLSAELSTSSCAAWYHLCDISNGALGHHGNMHLWRLVIKCWLLQREQVKAAFITYPDPRPIGLL